MKSFRDTKRKDKELRRGQIYVYLLLQWTGFTVFISAESHLSRLNNNMSSCQLKDLSDIKCMFAIGEGRKEQAEIVGYVKTDVERVEVVPGLQTIIWTETKHFHSYFAVAASFRLYK